MWRQRPSFSQGTSDCCEVVRRCSHGLAQSFGKLKEFSFTSRSIRHMAEELWPLLSERGNFPLPELWAGQEARTPREPHLHQAWDMSLIDYTFPGSPTEKHTVTPGNIPARSEIGTFRQQPETYVGVLLIRTKDNYFTCLRYWDYIPCNVVLLVYHLVIFCVGLLSAFSIRHSLLLR